MILRMLWLLSSPWQLKLHQVKRPLSFSIGRKAARNLRERPPPFLGDLLFLFGLFVFLSKDYYALLRFPEH